MNPILMAVIIDIIIFIDTSNDDEIDPDAASRLHEQIAYALRQLPSAERADFARFVTQRQEEERRDPTRRDVADLLHTLAEDYGLVENTDDA
jgi:hypothetical protein